MQMLSRTWSPRVKPWILVQQMSVKLFFHIVPVRAVYDTAFMQSMNVSLVSAGIYTWQKIFNFVFFLFRISQTGFFIYFYYLWVNQAIPFWYMYIGTYEADPQIFGKGGDTICRPLDSSIVSISNGDLSKNLLETYHFL